MQTLLTMYFLISCKLQGGESLPNILWASRMWCSFGIYCFRADEIEKHMDSGVAINDTCIYEYIPKMCNLLMWCFNVWLQFQSKVTFLWTTLFFFFNEEEKVVLFCMSLYTSFAINKRSHLAFWHLAVVYIEQKGSCWLLI